MGSQPSQGRTAVHVITGARDAELAGDGDHLNKEDRYRRTDEYLDVMRKEWFSETPFDYQGRFYDVGQAFSPMRPRNLPVFFGGSSDVAIEIAAKHADVYATWGEPLEQVRLLVERVRGAAAKFGRRPGFSLSLRPIIAGTEEAAWKRANDIVEQVREAREKAGLTTKNHAAEGTGSQKLLEAASRGYRVDKCLWTGLAAVSGAVGNSTGLVGTPEQVADAMLDYYDVGIDHFLIRGFNPIDDGVAYGRDLIPLVRELVSKRRPHSEAQS